MSNELKKIGVNFYDDDGVWTLDKRNTEFSSEASIETYEDHRMAMAFAPLALKVPITINDFRVVSKSYPSFWEDLKKIKFTQIIN